jgi:hypothetical protein
MQALLWEAKRGLETNKERLIFNNLREAVSFRARVQLVVATRLQAQQPSFRLHTSQRKTDLNVLWSDRLIEIFVVNPSMLCFGQEVLHGDLQGLDYDLGDMHILTLKIKEDIKFQRGINVNLNPGNFTRL